MSLMLMQNSWKTISKYKIKNNNTLPDDGYNLLYHKLILFSMKFGIETFYSKIWSTTAKLENIYNISLPV